MMIMKTGLRGKACLAVPGLNFTKPQKSNDKNLSACTLYCIFEISILPYGSHSGSGRLWRKTKKFLYFVFLLMILTLNVFHTRESFNHLAHNYQENYSSTHHQKKEAIMETNNKLSQNQTKLNPIQTSIHSGYHF